jgi:hypothetical protein
VDGHSIRKITPDGKVTTLLGLPDQAGYVHSLSHFNQDRGDQPCLNSPCGLAAFSNKLFISDAGNHVIRTVDVEPWDNKPGLRLQTLAGAPGQGELRWGLLRDGLPPRPGQEAYGALAAPQGLVFNGAGNLYVATGRGLAELSKLWVAGDFCGFDTTIGSKGQAKVGEPCTFRFQAANAEAPAFRWKAEFFTAEGVAAPPLGGWHAHPGTPFDEALEVTFKAPGRVTLLITAVTEAGITHHLTGILDVAPK